MTREGKQQLSIAYGSPGVRGLDGEGGLLHRRNTKNKPKQKKTQKNKTPKTQTKTQDRKAWTEISAEGPRLPQQQQTEAVVWLEKGRGCTGVGGVRGKAGWGL